VHRVSEFFDAVAVVTGGASGIGLATVRAFREAGASVVIVDLDASRVADVLKYLAGGSTTVSGVVGDVRDSSVRDAAVRSARDLNRPVRFLVNCAATFLAKGEDASAADWFLSLGVNVAGAALMASAVIPLMREAGEGAIVNVASISGYIAQPNRWTYNATKGAILSLTRCQALDLAADNIRVNSVSPGTIWTPELDRMINGDRAKWEPIMGPQHMLNRVGEPSEVASAILFLCGAGASFVTGADLLVDGGYVGMGHDDRSVTIGYTR
jgi:NAD(P)-dependent dehydrogenase (short-subunit alcohol dehydrogenase family)